MKRVILESPWQGGPKGRNPIYLNRLIQWCTREGLTPYASHRMLGRALRDSEPIERDIGILMGFDWHAVADEMIVGVDYGVSPGMLRGIENFQQDCPEKSIWSVEIGPNGEEKPAERWEHGTCKILVI